jgi:hypothetical protein
MKTTSFLLFAAASAAFAACSNPSDQIKPEEERMALEAVQSADLPELSFANESHDFGTINEGQVVETEFKFTNTGKAPLIISSAQGSCGCTVPEYPNAPVAPGDPRELQQRRQAQPAVKDGNAYHECRSEYEGAHDYRQRNP